MSDVSNAEDLSDLPLNQDGGGADNTTQLDKLDNEKLDNLLDEHIKGTARDTNTQTTGRSGQDRGQTTQDQRTQSQDRTQDTRGRGQGNQQQQVDDRRQGDDPRQANGGRPYQQRTIGPFLKQGPDGHVYDQNGRKVAAAGAGYTVATRIANLYEPVVREHAALKQRLEAIDSTNEIAKRAGLSIEESALGNRLMVSWKQDPKQTINFLLNQAQEKGIDISDIRSGGGFDTASFSTLLEERLAKALEPFQVFVRNAQQEQEHAELVDQVKQDLQAFHEEFPGAAMHGPVLAAIMDKTGYSPREAWFALRAEAAQAGWDLRKPLQGQAQATVDRRTPNGGGRPIPDMNGRNVNRGGGANPIVRAGSREVANVDDSYDTIINDVLNDLRAAQ